MEAINSTDNNLSYSLSSEAFVAGTQLVGLFETVDTKNKVQLIEPVVDSIISAVFYELNSENSAELARYFHDLSARLAVASERYYEKENLFLPPV